MEREERRELVMLLAESMPPLPVTRDRRIRSARLNEEFGFVRTATGTVKGLETFWAWEVRPAAFLVLLSKVQGFCMASKLDVSAGICRIIVII